MIVGRASGRIRPGRVLDRPGGPAEGVYLSMMDAMGVLVQEIGGVGEAVVPDHVSGPLHHLTRPLAGEPQDGDHQAGPGDVESGGVVLGRATHRRRDGVGVIGGTMPAAINSRAIS